VELVAPARIREEAAGKGEGEEAEEAWMREQTREWALGMLVDEVEVNLLVEMRRELPVRLVPRRRTPLLRWKHPTSGDTRGYQSGFKVGGLDDESALQEKAGGESQSSRNLRTLNLQGTKIYISSPRPPHQSLQTHPLCQMKQPICLSPTYNKQGPSERPQHNAFHPPNRVSRSPSMAPPPHRLEYLQTGPASQSQRTAISLMPVSYWFLLAPIIALDGYVSMGDIQKWLPWTSIFRIWQAGYTIFEEMKSDSFFLCSPSGSMLLTCDVHLIKQVLGRAHDFHAPVEVLSLYNLYGPTLAASEGEQWRLYRKISTPFFNGRTHSRVWKESLEKAERISAQWSKGGTRIADVKGEVMSKLNLRVIAKIFYNQELEYDRNDATKDVAPSGHSLTFSEAINAVLSNLATLFGLPEWLLAKSPFESHQHAYLGYLEWRQYMHEMRDSVQSQLEEAKRKEEPCFLESLVISSNAESKQEQSQSLTEAEVLGNMFFYVMAGFDTTSTTLSFVFLLLALHPPCQALLQQEVDQVLGSRSLSEWNADDHLQQLLNGYLGAVISETLRLYHPVAWYARKSIRQTTVTDSKGASHLIPADTVLMIDVAAMGRHPQYWPSENTGTGPNQTSPALDFNPSRWLKSETQEDLGKGAAFPFSSGHRMCPGKRFAEVEMCAMIARFFSQFSLRLEPDDNDVELAELAGHSPAWVEQKTKERAADVLFKGLGFGHGIYPKSHTPFEIIPRSDKSQMVE
ncbi:MAG: hypothetical protein Q9184_006058, partial [Pyrenodesmia sp. 2 TL-2023]